MRFTAAASTIAIAISSLALAGCTTTAAPVAAPVMPAEQPAAPGAQARTMVPTQLPTTVRPVHYTISAVPDPANLRFSARTDIQIQVLDQTDSITLNAADLEFGEVSLGGGEADGRGTLALNPTDIKIDAENQTATFTFAQPIAPGAYRLTANYTGKIYTQAAGLFALDYKGAGGEDKRALFTQFQAPDARRFFPSWDEPQYRTPYDLSVTVPAGQDAISNMPVAETQPQAGGTKVVRFQTTPSMPSYLLFLGMGEFDRITTMAAGTEIGIVTKRGDGEKGRFALEGSAQLLPYYNDYFGTPYPLPKLDNIAGPGSSQFFSAMENWGAIFSFENILLNDPATTSEARRQAIFEVAAHEMAHQWFGNLVTMAWWNDLWLNEGFASWMATKATDALHPEWQPLLGRIGSRESAINLDSVKTTHPVIQEVTTVDQISQAFDAITYSKGEAVITMLEGYVGEDAWRRGVQDYMRTYRLGNTVTDDLWNKIETAAGKPVTAIAHDFTLQAGVPLIRVEDATCTGGATNVTLRQGEFTRDRPDKQPLSWRVPVIASTVGGAEERAVVTGSANMSLPGCGAVLVNAGQTGYYRTLYTPALLDRLTGSYAQLKPADQLGLLSETWGLGLAGYQPASEALDIIDAAPANATPQLYSRMAGILGSIYNMYDGDAQRQAMVARYTSAKLGPVLAQLGWSAKPGEPATHAILRSSLIGMLGLMRDPAVVAEANRRFASTDPAAINGPLRSTILTVVALNADTAMWNRLHTRAKAEKDNLLRSEYYQLLGVTKNETLARRALALALTDEPGTTNSANILGAVAARNPDLAYDFALQNRVAVEAFVDASSRSRYFPGLAGGSADPAMIAKLQDYAQKYMTPQSRRPADVAIAAIQDRIRVRRERLPDITRWLDQRAQS